MKIISKYKDYYDYLTGIYGIDDKLILDRTEFYNSNIPIFDKKITFIICGLIIDGLFHDGKFYYGEILRTFVERRKSERRNNYHYKLLYFGADTNTVYIKTYGCKNSLAFSIKPIIDKSKFNENLDCPILIVDNLGDYELSGIRVSKFPILKDYNIQSILKPNDIYQMIYDFLSRSKDIVNNQTDKEKIIGKGFDYKHSFRNTK